jgi:prepilin-type N-terminal cleavage/methylation domain-containing protein
MLRARAQSMGRRRGATLIELLVVMAMIGLLITILIPSLKQSMDLASDTLCKNSLREIGHVLKFYRYDNNGWLPVPQRLPAVVVQSTKYESWLGKLFPTYADNLQLFVCPDDPWGYQLLKQYGGINDGSCFGEERHCADADVEYDIRAPHYTSYGLSEFLATSGGGYLAEERQQPTRPHDTILVGDIGPDSDMVSGGIGGNQIARQWIPPRNSGLLHWDDGMGPFQTWSAEGPWLTGRHGRGINMLTLGGEVREARTTETIRRPLERYYEKCATGGCTFCNELRLRHYSFAEDQLYWWTGPIPAE